jgi:hypothetical protein
VPPYADHREVLATMCEVWATTIYGREALDTYAAPDAGAAAQRST